MVEQRAEADLVDIQQKELDVLGELLEIFSKYDLSYFVTGGTVLGSKYYGDFIPYDDDIDIAMPRDDYDKFLKVARLDLSDGFKMRHYSLDSSFKYTIIRVENENIDIYETSDPNKKISHPSIDIAPLDGSPNSMFGRKVYFLRLNVLRALLSWHYADSINLSHERSFKEKILIKLIKLTSPVGKLLSPTTIKRAIDLLLSKYAMNDSDFVGTYMGAYREREMISKAIWGEGKSVSFNKYNVTAPEDVEAYIKTMYGSFRELSTEEALKMRHYILVKKD